MEQSRAIVTAKSDLRLRKELDTRISLKERLGQPTPHSDASDPAGDRQPGTEYSIEMDGYPTTTTARPTRAGELPPAIAMVSFEVDSLEAVKASVLATPQGIPDAPYGGRRVAVTRGPAGELIELIAKE
jgi:hypothetical protein